MTEVDLELKTDDPNVIEVLVSNHRRFLGFLAARLPDRACAEEILQQSLLKAIERQHTLDNDTSVVAWFYSILRNAIADFYRARARQATQQEEYVQERLRTASADQLKDEVCNCFRDLLSTLKPSYAAVLDRVDLQGRSISDVAKELQLTPNNLMVRLHRARHALRLRLEQACGTCAEHGCLNCTCSRKL